jgi:hypothetical protein
MRHCSVEMEGMAHVIKNRPYDQNVYSQGVPQPTNQPTIYESNLILG